MSPKKRKPRTPKEAADDWRGHRADCWPCRYYTNPCDVGAKFRKIWWELANEAMDTIWKPR